MRILAVISFVGQYMSVNQLSWIDSRIWRFLRLKYLAHLWNWVFITMAITDLLLPYKIVAFFGLYPISS